MFKLSPSRTETVLYSFTGGSDGGNPAAGLYADSAGNLYGTTSGGGPSASACPASITNNFIAGCGVVFKLSPSGTETVLHSFTGGSSDGANPQAGLIADSSGNLYGTAEIGGSSVCAALFCGGVVFKLSPSGTYTVLYTFCSLLPDCSDGQRPTGGLIADSSGNLYGTTSAGGLCTGCGGVVFKLAPPIPPATSWTETVLYSFTGGSDGANPLAGLIADSSGNLYGTTSQGGASNNGVVYKLAGTGFVTTTPFSTFSAQLQLDVNANPAKDALALETSFTLGMKAPAINPLNQAVTFQVGPYSATIPAGKFKQSGPLFTYAGTISGVNVQALITQTGTMRYAFAAAAEHPNLTSITKNPVPVTLTIGSDSGTKPVTAIIFH